MVLSRIATQRETDHAAVVPYFIFPYCHWSVSVVDLLIFHRTYLRAGTDPIRMTTLADIRERSDLKNLEAHYSVSLNDTVPYIQ